MQYAAGIGILSLALFLSAWLGLWQEQTYKMYGKRWREALFYCVSSCKPVFKEWTFHKLTITPQHFLSLPFFLPFYPSLHETYNSYASSQPITLLRIPSPSTHFVTLLTEPSGYLLVDGWMGKLIRWKELVIPSALFALGVNVVTQGLCIRGVNRLTSVSYASRGARWMRARRDQLGID